MPPGNQQQQQPTVKDDDVDDNDDDDDGELSHISCFLAVPTEALPTDERTNQKFVLAPYHV